MDKIDIRELCDESARFAIRRPRPGRAARSAEQSPNTVDVHELCDESHRFNVASPGPHSIADWASPRSRRELLPLAG